MGDPDRPHRRFGIRGRSEQLPPDDLTPEQAEEAIAWQPLEWLYVFDPFDRQIARFRGEADGVDLSDQFMARSGPLGLYGESVLKDHLIVHNHPPATEHDLVVSFPPSSSDLLVTVERDLRALIVVSGSSRYEVRRPGPNWPYDEDLLAAAIAELGVALDATLGPFPMTLAGRVERQRRRLERLHELGVVHYGEKPPSTDV